jgi:hypothetical protein
MSAPPTLYEILKFIALIIGLFGGLPRLIEGLISPNLKIDDISIERHEADDVVPTRHWAILHWRITNAKRYRIFGKNALEVETHWNVSIKGQEDTWTYFSNKPEQISFLYLGQNWPQSTQVTGPFPDEDYVFKFQMTSQGKDSGSETIPFPKEKFQPSISH